jgi:hypothetical protein
VDQRFAQLASHLRAGNAPKGVTVLKRNNLRIVARTEDAILKVFLRVDRRVAREIRALRRARGLGIYVPELDASRMGWSPGSPACILDPSGARFGVRVVKRRRMQNLSRLDATLVDAFPNSLRERLISRYLAM